MQRRMRSIIRPTQSRSLSYRGYTENLVGGTTYSGADFGSTSGRSLVAVFVFGYAATSRKVSSATIGGTAATLITNPSGTPFINLIVAAASGTSGDIVITPSAALIASAIMVYALYGLSSVTPYDSNSGGGSNGQSISGGVLADSLILLSVSNKATGYTWGNPPERVHLDYGADFNGIYGISCGSKAEAYAWKNQNAAIRTGPTSGMTSPGYSYGIWQ